MTSTQNSDRILVMFLPHKRLFIVIKPIAKKCNKFWSNVIMTNFCSYELLLKVARFEDMVHCDKEKSINNTITIISLEDRGQKF